VIRQIRRHISPASTFQTLVVALVSSRLDYGSGVLVGLPAYLVRRLHSVLNASARMIFQQRRSDHVTDVLVSLHWLRVPDRMQFKIAVLTYNVLYAIAPRLLGPLGRVSNLSGPRCLRSASTDRLVVPSFKLSTIGRRTFRVAAAQTWNGLREDVTTSPTLPIFIKRLKSHLLHQSYPDIALYVRACCGLVRTTLHYQWKNCLRLLTKLRIINVTYVACIISIFIISFIIFMLLYMIVRIVL